MKPVCFMKFTEIKQLDSFGNDWFLLLLGKCSHMLYIVEHFKNIVH